MIKFWSGNNCILLHWQKKLTLVQGLEKCLNIQLVQIYWTIANVKECVFSKNSLSESLALSESIRTKWICTSCNFFAVKKIATCEDLVYIDGRNFDNREILNTGLLLWVSMCIRQMPTHFEDKIDCVVYLASFFKGIRFLA